MQLDTLDSLLVDQLRDVFYAEKQLAKTLPKLARKANAPMLQAAFRDHAGETEEHIMRLERAFEALGVSPKTKRCPAIEALSRRSPR